MRIVFVADQLDCGGAEQQLVTLSKGLRARGHEVHVASIYDRMELRPELDAADIPSSVVHKYSKYDLMAAWRLRTLIHRVSPQLVHAYLPVASFLAPLTAWMGVRVPVLQSERGINDWRSPFRLHCDNIVRKAVAHITCNAEAIKRHLVAVEGVSEKKVSVIHNGLREDRRSRPSEHAVAAAQEHIGAPKGSIVVICVANFSPVKQHDLLLRAFAQAKTEVGKLFLVLVGRGELEMQVRGQIDALGLGGACRVITNCTDPAALLCASQVSALASRVEGCSNALLEAMAMGLPVVAFDTGGNPELIATERGGHLCPVDDIRSFSRALIRLANAPEMAAAMGQYNSRRIREDFTDDVMVSRSLSLYSRILGLP